MALQHPLRDNTTRVLDLGSGEEPLKFEGHTDIVTSPSPFEHASRRPVNRWRAARGSYLDSPYLALQRACTRALSIAHPSTCMRLYQRHPPSACFQKLQGGKAGRYCGAEAGIYIEASRAAAPQVVGTPR